MPLALIIDDDEIICLALARILSSLGCKSRLAFNLRKGLALAESEIFDLVILDIRLPDGNGIDVLHQLKSRPYNPEILVLTNYGDADSAGEAFEQGAWEYVVKPPSLNELIPMFNKVLAYHQEKRARTTGVEFRRCGIIGDSSLILDCLFQLTQAAASNINLLITGETGTGKEIFARAAHLNSPRKDHPFVVVDCAALPTTLTESVLFGHEKGAFTSADSRQPGLVKMADKGTLFLDEIGELPLETQKSLLRIIQEKKIRPLGNDSEIDCDFRLIVATNKDLADSVARGDFRDDLFYRLQGMTIKLPPLRERLEDIPALADFHLKRIAVLFNRKVQSPSPAFLEALATYTWPGNIRELVNVLEYAVTRSSAGENTLEQWHLPVNIRTFVIGNAVGFREQEKTESTTAGPDSQAPPPALQDYRQEEMDRLQADYLNHLLEHTHGRIDEAIEIAGISRSQFYTLLKKYHIPTPRRLHGPKKTT